MSIVNFFLDSSRRLRTVWRFSIFLTGLQIVNIGVGIVVAIVATVFLLATGHAESGDDVVKLLTESTSLLICIATLPLTFFTVSLVWICRRFLDRRSLVSLGLTKPEPRLTASIWIGLAAGMVVIGLSVLILLVFGRVEFLGIGGSVFAIALIPMFLLAAFAEELVCRGYLLQNMFDIGRPISGVVVSSIIFWLMHGLNPDVWTSPVILLNLFLAGVVLALAYIVSGNIWFPTALHFGWNFCQGSIFGMPISGIPVEGMLRFRRGGSDTDILTGGSFGLEGSIIVLFLQVILITSLFLILRRREYQVKNVP